MESANEDFRLNAAIEEALGELTIGQRTIMERREFTGFAFEVKGKKPDHHRQWLDGFMKYITDNVGTDDPAKIKAFAEDYLNREVHNLQKKLSSTQDDAEKKDHLLAMEEFLKKLIEVLGGHKKTKKSTEKNPNSAAKIFSKENLTDEKTVGNLVDQFKYAVGTVMGWFGAESWAKRLKAPWQDKVTESETKRNAKAEQTVRRLRDEAVRKPSWNQLPAPPKIEPTMPSPVAEAATAPTIVTEPAVTATTLPDMANLPKTTTGNALAS